MDPQYDFGGPTWCAVLVAAALALILLAGVLSKVLPLMGPVGGQP